MTSKREALIETFRSLNKGEKALVAFTALTPVAMGFISYQGIANHFYEASHTTLEKGNITYRLTDASTVTQKKDGQKYTYDFQSNTVSVSDAELKPKIVTAGLQTFQTYSASRVRDQASPDADIKPADPAAMAQAREAGCRIADHLDKLDGAGAPLVGPAHARIQERGRAFKADFC